MQTEWLKAYYVFKLINSWKRHKHFGAVLGYWHRTALPKSCPSAPTDHLCSFLQLILWICLYPQVFSPHISPLATSESTMKCCYQFPKSQLMWCRRLLAHSKCKEGSQLHPKQRKDWSKRGDVYHLSLYREKQHLFSQWCVVMPASPDTWQSLSPHCLHGQQLSLFTFAKPHALTFRMDLSEPSIKRLGRLQNETFLTQRQPCFWLCRVSQGAIDAFS